MNDNDGNVVILDMATTHDLPPDRLLTQAIGRLDSVLVIGWDKEGQEYFTSSVADGGDALWLIERFKRALLSAVD